VLTHQLGIEPFRDGLEPPYHKHGTPALSSRLVQGDGVEPPARSL